MKYKWTVEFEVSESWVQDGFNLDDERANDMIQHSLPYATSVEAKAKVLSAPKKADIKKIQGE